MAALDQVFRAGFQQHTLVREDPFFESLQDEPAFQEFVNDHARRIQTRLRQEAQQAMADHEPFDFDFELPDLDAQPVKLADFQGKLVIVDVWGYLVSALPPRNPTLHQAPQYVCGGSGHRRHQL